MKAKWIAFCAALAGAAWTQQAPQVIPATVNLPAVPVEEIIRKFAAKES